MKANEQMTAPSTGDGERKVSWQRRRLVPLTLALVVVAALLVPWSASVGNYGKPIALPDHEAVIRASESRRFSPSADHWPPTTDHWPP